MERSLAASLSAIGGSHRVKILGIKHLAIAVSDCDAALARYQQFLGVGMDTKPRDLVVGGSREAHFDFGDVQIQLCQSLTPDHRFARFIAEHGEGLHHTCLSVDDVARCRRALPGRRRHPQGVQSLRRDRRARAPRGLDRLPGGRLRARHGDRVHAGLSGRRNAGALPSKRGINNALDTTRNREVENGVMAINPAAARALQGPFRTWQTGPLGPGVGGTDAGQLRWK